MILPGSKDWQLDPAFAHPTARVLFQEPFFWDAIDDSAPWCSDEGADALAAFGQAHDKNGAPPDPASFAVNWAGEDWQKTPPTGEGSDDLLEAYSAGNLKVIAVALGMLLLHGYVPARAKEIGFEAIERELQPNCYTQFGFPEERVAKLKVYRERLQRAESEP